MKKLISVFAALALVGSLAAQKGKKAPAKPAAPAVAAPKVPAVPAVVAAAPAAAGAAKGVGLFIEGRGTFTLGQGTSDSQATGSQTATSIEYKLANTSGFGGGATIGYEIAQGLGLVASFDYRSIKSREWDQTSATVSAGVTGTVKAYQKTDTMVLGFGFRPSIKALGGTWYAGMGFAYVLPFESVTTNEISNSSAAAFAVTKTETTSSKNAGIGAYGEFGYQFSITDNLYIGLGARALVATANNDGKSDVKKTTGTASGAAVADVTTNYAATVDSTATPVKTKYSSTGITDVSATVTVGFRF